MSWLFQQPVMWQEIGLGILFTVIALYAEDFIDQWRNRKKRGEEQH